MEAADDGDDVALRDDDATEESCIEAVEVVYADDAELLLAGDDEAMEAVALEDDEADAVSISESTIDAVEAVDPLDALRDDASDGVELRMEAVSAADEEGLLDVLREEEGGVAVEGGRRLEAGATDFFLGAINGLVFAVLLLLRVLDCPLCAAALVELNPLDGGAPFPVKDTFNGFVRPSAAAFVGPF